ncbi:MAG: hypothetical protein JO189_18985 [Deltaproteobacteria bacterium]|nr:hypothetical protein [Deltaproteobacteria bacterium]
MRRESQHEDAIFTTEVGVDSYDVERRATRAFWLNEKHLAIAALYPHCTFAPRSFEKSGELLSCFGKRIDGHERISNVLLIIA